MHFRWVAPLAALLFLGPVPAGAFDPLGPGAIVATVRDRDGRPIAGALVTAVGPAERHATTESAGIVSLVALPLGTYHVQILRPGYERAESAVTLGTLHGFGTLDVHLTRSALGIAPTTLSGESHARALTTDDPSLAHALVAVPNVDLPGGAYGTAPYETKVTLDGIPLGGPSTGAAAFRPDALALSSLAVGAGPDALAPSLDGVVGGNIDLRTQPARGARDARAAAGYASGFGSFQRLDGAEWSGPLAASLDTVVGGGIERDRVLRTAVAFSSTTSFGFDSYNFNRNAVAGGATSALAAVNEPAYSAHLGTRAFGGSFDVRSFGSDYSAANGSERTRALAAAYERSVGAGTLDVAVSRSANAVTANGGSALNQITTTTAHTAFKLGAAGSLDVADSLSDGTSVGPRQDPHVALALPAGGAWTLRATAGSSYLTTPYEVLVNDPAAVYAPPETSFGYGAGADLALASGGTLSVGAFQLTRWNRFATLADARSRGIDVGVSRLAPAVGWGFDAGLGFAHDDAFGPQQPAWRVVQSVPLQGGSIDGVADTRARLGLTFRTAKGTTFGATALALGANNGITAGPLRYLDLSAGIPLFKTFALRVDGATPLGSVAPRSLSISFGAATPAQAAR